MRFKRHVKTACQAVLQKEMRQDAYVRAISCKFEQVKERNIDADNQAFQRFRGPSEASEQKKTYFATSLVCCMFYFSRL